jgi:hypothetical protein
MRLVDLSPLRRPRFVVSCVWLWLSLGIACADDAELSGEPSAGAAAHGGSGDQSASGHAAAGSGGKAGASNAGSLAKAGAGGAQAGGGAGAAKAGTGGVEADAGGADAGPAVCNLNCAQGQHCELVAVTCVRAPCPAQPMCVADPSSGAGDGLVDCDPSKILCKRASPKCAGGDVPSVSGSCYGDCVPVETCRCAKPSACPLPDEYTCHMSAGHCGPFVE